MNKETIKQIKSEIKFLESREIVDLVHDADIGSCHSCYAPIVERIIELKSKLPKNRISEKEWFEQYPLTTIIEDKVYPLMNRKAFLDLKKKGLTPKGMKPIPIKYAEKIDKIFNP